jgi:hypothetical protein
MFDVAYTNWRQLLCPLHKQCPTWKRFDRSDSRHADAADKNDLLSNRWQRFVSPRRGIDGGEHRKVHFFDVQLSIPDVRVHTDGVSVRRQKD